ncbi:hypothetical protein KR018_012430 [Drosophila ironensis]|nr:hypothetical protein KR018_012430 [Drosophila ironensis]
MSLYDWRPHQYAACVLAGLSGFICGVFVQQEVSIKQLFQQIRRDPYIYYHRHRLYPMLSTFRTDHEKRLWNRSTSFGDKLRQMVISPFFDLLSAIFLLKNDNATTTDLLDLIKYGLPSAEDLFVHKDYIVSQDMRINCPRWICEHFRGDYQKIGPDESGYASLNLRYNDVYVLSCNSMNMCKAFKRRIWNDLEEYVAEKAKEYGSVYAYTGPIYMPYCYATGEWSIKYELIDWSPVPVPSHYFKVLIMDVQTPGSCPYMEGFIIENSRVVGGKLKDHVRRVEDIERFTGLKFNKDLRLAVHFDKDVYKLDTSCFTGHLHEISEPLMALPTNQREIIDDPDL